MNRPVVLTAPNYAGYLLLSIARVFRSTTKETLAPIGLDTNHIAVIDVLRRAEQASQRELGRVLRTDRTTMVKLIDDLEAKGMVERGFAEDRRIHSVRLTVTGLAIAKKMDRLVLAAERDVLRRLTPQDRSNLKALLERVHESLPPFES